MRPPAALLVFISLTALPVKAQELKLLISVQQQTVVAPSPVRLTLQFHNSGRQALWLYRPVTNQLPPVAPGSIDSATDEPGANSTSGGSTLQIQMAPPGGQDGAAQDARARVIVSQGLPQPQMVWLAPGKDYDEKVAVDVRPSTVGTGLGARFVQGQYQFSVTYSAHYSNQDGLARDLNIDLWHGSVKSNSVTLSFVPPAAQGSIEGTVVDPTGRPFEGNLVTLSDANEDSLNQTTTDSGGRFSFTHLPWGRYWIAARQPEAAEDATVFRHFDLSESAPHATAQLMLLPVEINQSSQILHKPVIFRVVDGTDHPLEGVRLAIVWSNGLVLENAKAETNADGAAAISLIPGSNFVTLQRRGCQNQDQRTDVAPGAGIDGFKFTFDCTKK